MNEVFDHNQTAGAVADVAFFAAPKQGHTPDEYEDAHAVSALDAWPLRAAVADGATESAFSRDWAQILAAEWVREAPDVGENWRKRLAVGRRQWQSRVDKRTPQQPWYAAAKAEQGAFAAFLGLRLHADGTWRALCIGDCALMHLREDDLIAAWPHSDPEAFTHRPALVASRSGTRDPAPVSRSGAWADGDAFLLVSDALAAWLLSTDPAQALRWDAAAAEAAIHRARSDGALRNDDVTVVRLVPHVP